MTEVPALEEWVFDLSLIDNADYTPPFWGKPFDILFEGRKEGATRETVFETFLLEKEYLCEEVLVKLRDDFQKTEVSATISQMFWLINNNGGFLPTDGEQAVFFIQNDSDLWSVAVGWQPPPGSPNLDVPRDRWEIVPFCPNDNNWLSYWPPGTIFFVPKSQ